MCTHALTCQAPRVIAMPQRMLVRRLDGGILYAGAMRTPQTLERAHSKPSHSSHSEGDSCKCQERCSRISEASKKGSINQFPETRQVG